MEFSGLLTLGGLFLLLAILTEGWWGIKSGTSERERNTSPQDEACPCAYPSSNKPTRKKRDPSSL